MNGVMAVMRRELRGYFVTPLAYVFIVIFLVLAGWFTFNFGNFLQRRAGESRSVLQLSPVVVPVSGSGAVHAPVGRGTQDRNH